ncbi:MAG: sensor histidine kinase [Armatimonadota bacterium]|jgi:signal transduction histidine kinase
MMFKSIRARLTAAFSLYLALLIIVAIVSLICYARYFAERNAIKALTAAAESAVAESQQYDNLTDLIAEEQEDLTGTELTLSIVDEDGRVIGKTRDDAPSQPDVPDWRIVTSKLPNGATVVVGMPWARTSKTLQYHTLLLSLLGVFVVIIAAVGAWVLVGRALNPIPLLARQAKVSSVDNLTISLNPPSQDREMVELVDTLNGLLRRITETAAAKGRFYSAASHELRTPLQALSGHLELAMSRERSKEEYKSAMEEAYTQAKRLVSLVRALLLLYQFESLTSLPPKEPADMVDICNRSLVHYRQAVDERRLRVSLNAPDEAELLTPPSHLEILVRNLIENAAKYCSMGGFIEINIGADDGSVRLEISNDSDQPLTWKPEEFFEPFSRWDTSRNARTGGTGLGLAICKSIADANGWRLDVISVDSRFYASLLIETQSGSTMTG